MILLSLIIIVKVLTEEFLTSMIHTFISLNIIFMLEFHINWIPCSEHLRKLFWKWQKIIPSTKTLHLRRSKYCILYIRGADAICKFTLLRHHFTGRRFNIGTSYMCWWIDEENFIFFYQSLWFIILFIVH